MQDSTFRNHFLAIATPLLFFLFACGVFFYYFLYRQINAKLIETIPTDAAFLFQINDNETFLKTVKKIHPYINPLFGLDAYPGCQFFVDQLPGKYNQVVFSGHANGETFSILFACKIKERAFKHLLTKLQIDEKNSTKYERCKIYTYGTHLKRFVFTYDKGIFLASENIMLLKKAINQLRTPRNLTALRSFETVFNIMEKNTKQNWLTLNHDRYFSNFEPFFNTETYADLTRFAATTHWSAYQVRFLGLDMQLSGYLSINEQYKVYMDNIEQKHLYYSSLSKTDAPIDYEQDVLLKYAKSVFPSHSEFDFAIHAANAEYWNRYLSEQGMKKFAVARMQMFALSIDSLNTKLKTANGLVRF